MRKTHLYVSNFRSFEETYLVRVEELPNVASFSVNILSVLKATDTSFSFHLLHFNFAGPWMPTLTLKRQRLENLCISPFTMPTEVVLTVLYVIYQTLLRN